MSSGFWTGRRVLVTGHTGFKGGWLCLWLHALGAEVHGLALRPPTGPSLFDAANVTSATASSTIADIRDREAVDAVVRDARPEVVLHLAAQPLVRAAYERPVETIAVNVLGVANLLEALRGAPSVRSVVIVTTDKCYENQDWTWGYRETDTLGGHDPYSASKACAELVTTAYRRSFLSARGVALATARAGNVIGGGDWAADRLIPDALRAIDAAAPMKVRAPGATRPWQHVLEPLAGYLALAERLHVDGQDFAEPWNFGPEDDDARSVAWVLSRLAARGTGLEWSADAGSGPHEARALKLDSSKARARLAWRPRWRLEEALDKTLEWHRAWRSGRDMRSITLEQISAYSRATAASGGGSGHVAT